MNNNDTNGAIVEEFLGRIRIGDMPDVNDFVAAHPEAQDPDELRELLTMLIDVERLTFPSVSGGELPMPDLTSCGFRLLKKIGAGGMGVVYEALQINLGRHVAVKLLRPELLADPEIRELFKLEARILARFNHPGIVRIIGTGHCDDNFFYIMELIEDQHLDTLSQPPDEKQLLRWAVEASDALSCAHGHGIVHGDIKPANLLLDRNGHLRICDFGLAFNSRPTSEENSGRHDGTVRYMAPELLSGGDKNFSSDQYALCASLAEIAAAKPFDRNSDRALTFSNAQLAAVIVKGLAADPDDRYPSVGELRDDLRRILRHEPVSAGRTPLFTRIRLFCKRHPIHSVTAALLLLCLTTLVHGLVRTESALQLAKRNAATASTAIGKVFDGMVEMPPSPEITELLARLIPYYEQIVSNPNIPPSELTGALTKLAQSAMRVGNYELAEHTLLRLMELDESSDNLCRLAETLFRLGKNDEADRIFNKIIDRYSDGDPEDRLDAVWSHLHFMNINRDSLSDHIQPARHILAEYLAAAPDDDKALFLYAQLLRLGSEASAIPIPGLSSNPLEILDDISTLNPNNGRYWQNFIDSATEWLKASDISEECPATIRAALEKSDIMLWRFMNRPHTVSSALALKRAYANRVRDADGRHGVSNGPSPINTLLRVLLNQPNLPEQDQSDLIALSLDSLERPIPPQRPPSMRSLDLLQHHPTERLQKIRARRLQELRKHLELHSLPRRDELLHRIRALESALQSSD